MIKKFLVLFVAATLSQALNSAGAVTLDGVKGQHGIAMHGDLKYANGFKHFEYANPTAPKGGKVRLHAIGTFDSFNGFIVKGNSAAGLGLIYNTLMTGSADEAFSQYGELAKEVYMPKDRSWVAFKLREDARWHDGRSITPEDVIWTFNTLIKHGQPFFRFYYGDVQEVVKVSSHIVRFSFKPTENRELPLIIGQLTILPKHYWKDRDFTKTTLEPPLGSGPYKIKNFEPGRSVTIERVQDYWGKDIGVNKGFYNFNEIRYDYYRDSTIALEAFKAGEYDYRSENSSKAWATAYDIPATKNGLIKKEGIKHNRSTGMQGFIFNTRREMFKDQRLRQALAFAFDFEWSNKNLFYGQYSRSRSYFDNSELAASNLPDADELKFLNPLRGKVPDKVFTKSYEPPKGGGPRQLRKNLRLAGKLLDKAGWKLKGRQRVHEQTGQALKFEVMLVSPLFERIVLPFGKNLEKLGVKVTVRTVDSSQYRRRLDTYDFDMIVGTYGQSLSPGNEQRSFWSSKAAKIEGGRNYIGISDHAIDSLVESIIAAPDRRNLIAATRSLDRVLQWGHWLIPHWHIKFDRIAYWSKFGRPKQIPVQGNQFTAWWIDLKSATALKGKLASEKD